MGQQDSVHIDISYRSEGPLFIQSYKHVCVWLHGCNEIVMYGMKGCSTAVIHQPSEGAGSAEWTEGWHCCRYWAMVDGVIRAFTVFQGFCLLMATNQEEGVGKELQHVCYCNQTQRTLFLFLVLCLCQQSKYSKLYFTVLCLCTALLNCWLNWNSLLCYSWMTD